MSFTWTEADDYGQRDCEECGGCVTPAADGFGTWLWQVIVSEPYVSGPYPGTPDWHEYNLGEGEAPTEAEAMRRAEECFTAAMEAQDRYEAEMERQMEEADEAQAAWEREEMERDRYEINSAEDVYYAAD